MPGDTFKLHEGESEPDYEKLIDRMCRAGWIDSVTERRDVALDFHFTPLGKERFRTLFAIMGELGNERDLMNAFQRSELLAVVEAWIQDVEEQED